MKRFIQTRLFLVSKESSQSNCNSNELEKAYDEFAGALFTECRETIDRTALYHALCYTHVEMKSLRCQLASEPEKKMC
ncbi:hypothetical protein EZS27_028334 [termite gut metagenome]|uniref:Uncharacterized protein n=1 Tax=termite gut metagenome TaxID=433724 RepID=A0A5J4QLC4_9ZZZZ